MAIRKCLYPIALIVLAALVPGFSGKSFGAGGSIGVLMTADTPFYQDVHKVFVKAMASRGIVVNLQTPMPDPMSWANAAKKLTAIGSDVIVAYGAPAALSAMKATSSIPVVFAGVYDPQGMGLSGKNATGIGSTVSVKASLERLAKIKKFKTLAVIFGKIEKDTILQAKEAKESEQAMGFRTILIDANDSAQIAAIQADAVLITTSSIAYMKADSIMSASKNAGAAVLSLMSGLEAKGALLTCSADAKEQGEAAADMVVKVLAGEAPSSIQVMKMKEEFFTVNLKEAALQNLNVPADILAAADRTIK